jgi:hypothetical protein
MYVKVQKAYASIIKQLSDFLPNDNTDDKAERRKELLDLMNA